MADDSSTAPEVIDLASSPDRLVRVPGLENPVPAAQLMSKAELTRSSQAYARREQELREQFSAAADLMEQLQEDPVGFRDALNAKLVAAGYTDDQAAGMVDQAIENAGGGPRMTMNQDGSWELQQLREKVAQLELTQQATQAAFFEKVANEAIGSEVAQARELERQVAKLLDGEERDLSDDDLRRVLAYANEKGAKDLLMAYKAMKFDEVVKKGAKVREDLDVQSRKSQLPWAGVSEANIAPTQKKTLREIFDAKLRSL